MSNFDADKYERDLKRGEQALIVRGRRCFDWDETLKQLNREDRMEELLELLYECRAAVAEWAKILKFSMPPGWDKRIAIAKRKVARLEKKRAKNK